MVHARATTRMLDDEHREKLALLGRLERAVLALPAGERPDAGFAAVARAVARTITDEIERHFRLEEDALFPRLAAAGEDHMVALLVEEHSVIRATAHDALPLLLAAAGGTLGAEDFAVLRPLALELVERLVAHIDKETLGLLPMLDVVLDEATDHELAFAHADH